MPDLPWLVYAIPFMFIALIAGAAIYKWLQVRQAANWPSTPGKVVKSGSEVRKVEIFDDNREGGKAEEQRNFAAIVYEYTVSGQKLRNNRVSIGEDLGNFEVAETIARYPVGKVVTVYYNPRRPREAVLEREVPKGVFGCVVWLVVLGTAGILGAFFGFNQITIFLTERVNNAPMVVGLTAMGLVTLLFGWGMHRQAAAARRWPQVTARITRSEVDEFRGSLDNDSKRTTLYRPQLAYTYEFNGVSYTGSQASLGAKVTSNSAGYAKKLVAKYPEGRTFMVYVNPQNPSEAVLSPAVAAAWLIWVIAAGLFGVAYFVATH
jgi:hypothetical protein